MSDKLVADDLKSMKGLYSQPLVSVIMPAYRHEKFVEQAVRSVWEQSYPNVELIAIDDGSSDSTGKILEELAKESPIPMRVIRQKNQGICKTLNKGIKISKGAWISFLASDDAYFPNFIEKCMERGLSIAPEKVAIHCDAVQIDEFDNKMGRIYEISPLPPTKENAFMSLVFGKSRVIAITLFLNRKTIDHVGLFDESLQSEDYDYHLRLARIVSFEFIDEALVYSRELSNSLGRSPKKWASDGIKILAKHKNQLGRQYSTAVSWKYMRYFSNMVLNGHYLDSFSQAMGALINAKVISWPSLLFKIVFMYFYSSLKHILKVFGLNRKPKMLKRILNIFIVK